MYCNLLVPRDYQCMFILCSETSSSTRRQLEENHQPIIKPSLIFLVLIRDTQVTIQCRNICRGRDK